MLAIILCYWRRGNEAIRRGVTIVKLRRMKVLQEIIKMKLTIANDKVEKFDRLEAKLERSLDRLGAIYG